MIRGRRKTESGEVMIEGMIVMVITMLMLVWILGIFFLYYQKYTIRIATNDVAKKIAATYDAPSTEPITGYITPSELKNRPLYFGKDVAEDNKSRADSYVRYILDQTNFNGVVDVKSVDVAHIKDAMGRSHIEVTTICTFKTPFGEGLKWMGMDRTITYKVTSYADSTSLTDYISTVTVADAFLSGEIVSLPGVADSIVKVIESIMGLYGQIVE